MYVIHVHVPYYVIYNVITHYFQQKQVEKHVLRNTPTNGATALS